MDSQNNIKKLRHYLDDDCYLEIISDREILFFDAQKRGDTGLTGKFKITARNREIIIEMLKKPGIDINAITRNLNVKDNHLISTRLTKLRKRHPILAERTMAYEGEYHLGVCKTESLYTLPEKMIIDTPSNKQNENKDENYYNEKSFNKDLNKGVSLKSVPFHLRKVYIEGSRDDVFEALDESFSKTYADQETPNVVILHGMAGCGKSELAKHYADDRMLTEVFKTVVYASFSKEEKIKNNFETLIINDNLFNLSGISRNKGENDRHYFRRKLSAIQKSEGIDTTLIILDNCDDVNDEDVEKLLKYEYGVFKFSLLIISRNNLNEYPYDNFEHVFVDTMKMKYLVEIFRENVSDKYVDYASIFDEENKEIIEKIISLVGKHTLATEILRKNLAVSYCSLKEYYEKLTSADGLIFNEMEGKLRAGDYSNREPFEIIKRLFKISDVENITTKERLKRVLTFFYAIPIQGIEKEIILPFIKSYGPVINHLVERGWIDETKGIMSMHPLVREVAYDYCRTTDSNGKNVLKIENCSDIINEIMNADGDYESALYHEPWEYKQKISQLYQSLANVFPYSENKGEEFFWFYNRLRLNLGFCNQWEMQANIFSEMLSLETDEWKKAYLTYRTEQFPTTYWRKDNYIEIILAAAKKMENASCDESLVSDREKMELANLYRHVGSAYCNLMTPYPKRNAVKPEAVEEIFEKGESIVRELLKKEKPSKNALLYNGTISVWRAQLYTALRQIIEARDELYKANKIFADYGYINKVDKAAIFNGLALLNRRVGNETQEAKYFKKAINIFEKYFGIYNRPNVERHIRLYYAYAYEEDGFYANESAWDNAFYTIKKAYKISKEIDYMYSDVIEIIERDFSPKKRRATTPEIEEEYNLFLKEVLGDNN